MAVEIDALPEMGWERERTRAPLASEPPRFAHPAERLLADLLTFHRVRWEYEPTCFVLRRTELGEVAESFTPDFYLPDHGRYLELTTMRQPLVTRKNGKIRRLRELYPLVEIKTLYRRDYERIVETSGPRIVADRGAVVFAASEIQRRVTELAGDVAAALPQGALTRGPLLLAALRPEAAPFQRALSERLAEHGVACEFICLGLPRFNPAAPAPLAAQPGAASFQGRALLLVTGAVSTGLSLDFAWRVAASFEPVWLDAVSLLDRASARVVDAPVSFCGFQAPPECLSGFGLALTPDGGWWPSIVKANGKHPTRRHAAN